MNEQELREMILKMLNGFCQMDGVFDFSSTRNRTGISEAKLAAIDGFITDWRKSQPLPFDGEPVVTGNDDENDYGLEAVR